MTSRRGRIAAAVCGGLVVAAILWWLTTPRGLRAQLAAAVSPGCVSVTDNTAGPTQLLAEVPPGLAVPVGFARAAAQRAYIVCNELGPDTVYFRFADRPALTRALARYPAASRPGLCVLGAQVFTGAGLNPTGPVSLRALCRRLRGESEPPRRVRSSRGS